MTAETRKPVPAAAQPSSPHVPGHGMEGVAAAASVGRKARGALEPEHISVPVHQSHGEEGMGRQEGRRGALLPDQLRERKRGRQERRHQRRAQVSMGKPLSKDTRCTHSRVSHPRWAGRARDGSHDPAKAAEVTCNPPPAPQNRLWLPLPPLIPLPGFIQEKRGGCQRETKECSPAPLRCSLPCRRAVGSPAAPAPHLRVSNIYI